MAVRPPLPSSGNCALFPYGYQINAGCAGGKFIEPVLFGELFTGAAGLNAGPDTPVAKLKSRYGLLSAIMYGQPKLPACRAWLISSYPRGPREALSLLASGPTSPQ